MPGCSQDAHGSVSSASGRAGRWGHEPPARARRGLPPRTSREPHRPHEPAGAVRAQAAAGAVRGVGGVPRRVPRGHGSRRGRPSEVGASAAPPPTCRNGWWGRSWDQVGGGKRAPDLVPLPRQDTKEEQDGGGAAEAVQGCEASGAEASKVGSDGEATVTEVGSREQSSLGRSRRGVVARTGDGQDGFVERSVKRRGVGHDSGAGKSAQLGVTYDGGCFRS